MTVAVPKYWPVKNAATSTIPPFGVMYSSVEVNVDGFLMVNQPTDCTGMKNILVNDGTTIPREPYGFGQGHNTFPAVVAYEEQDGTPAYGEYWGPTLDSWKIRKGRPGFIIDGGALDGLVNVARQPESQRWQTFLNGAAQTAVAYGVLRVTGVTACVVQGARPNGTYTQYAINGPADVTATTGRGICTQDYPATALYDSADGTPVNGQVWGPGTDTFKLKKHYPGYVIVGDVDTTATTATIVPDTSFSGAQARRVNLQAIPTGAWTAIEFDNEAYPSFDTGNYFDIASPTKISLYRAGYYLITANLNFVYDTTGVRGLRIFGNAMNLASVYIGNPSLTGQGESGLAASVMMSSDGTSEVALQAYQDSGHSINVTSPTMLSAAWLGRSP